jgi:hypothetical protein
MDYTSDPDGPPSNEHPNSHDYAQLISIYTHVDSSTTIKAVQPSSSGQSGADDDEGPNDPADLGRAAGPRDGYGRDIVFTKDVSKGRRLITHVFWALPGSAPGAPPRR